MYQILITSLVAGLVAPLIKLFVPSNNLKFTWRDYTSYSGMPSGHAAYVFSLATIVGLKEGFSSPLFAVCFIFTLLVIRDAFGLRNIIGRQSKILNELTKASSQNKLTENIGHTPTQIIFGALLGIAISLISFYMF